MTNWQPIETAPRDGTEVIICWIDESGVNQPVFMIYDDEATNAMFPGVSGMWRTTTGSITWSEHMEGGGPTHWMPIPVVH